MAIAGAGRREAFEVLVARYLGRLTSYAAKFLGSVRRGEEVAQEALVDAWESRRRYRRQGRFQSFVFTLVRNRCLNKIRGERRWLGARSAGAAEDLPIGRGLPDEAPSQLDRLLEEERRRQVRAALLALSPKLRETILLRFDQGLEYAQIARIVGRPEATVRSRVFLALERLREALGPGEEP